MSYETRAYDKPAADGWPADPVVVLVVTGTHDVSRLVHLLSRGLVEQNEVGQTVQRQLRRHNGGTAALRLLAQHGGPDFTGESEELPIVRMGPDGSVAVQASPSEAASMLWTASPAAWEHWVDRQAEIASWRVLR